MTRSHAASDFVSRAAPRLLAGRERVRPALSVQDHMPRYSRYVFNQVRPFLKGAICEVGSGLGRFTQYLANYERVTALEPDGSMHMSALQSSAHQLNINHVHCSLEDCPNDKVAAGAYGTVMCLNLLEYIKYDITALEIMGELLCESGHLIVVVPAVRRLYGRLDRAQGRLRRYTRRVLEAAFHEAGLEVTRSFYFNLPGMFACWPLSRLLKRQTIPLGLAHFCDRLVPLIETTERFARPPLGLSLLMVAKRSQ